MILVLFDIDGTLLTANGAGKLAFSRALRRVFGWEDDLESIRFAGATDWAVYDHLLAHHGESHPEETRDAFFAVMEEELTVCLREGSPALFPGVAVLMERLGGLDSVQLGLVTGNTEGGARIKLRHFNLDHWFEVGGYGNDHPDRNQMALLARERAERALPEGVYHTECLLIGDTPSDVAAAKHIGASALAVHTGPYSADVLYEAGADLVAEDVLRVFRMHPTLSEHVEDLMTEHPV